MRLRAISVLAGSAVLLLFGMAPRGARVVLEATGVEPPPIFLTSDQCMACHNGLVTPSGEDISIGVDWRASIMANSSRDPYWQAAVRREVMDHPAAADEIQEDCTRCHMPMLNVQERARGRRPEVFAHLPIGEADTEADRLAADGVSCTLCHQITDEKLGTAASFTGGFVVDTTRVDGHGRIFGPFDVDTGRTTIMRSATTFEPIEAAHIRSSELCATCHTLYRETLGPGGEVIGRIPEQMPYLEWLNSSYRSVQSCQDCHMAAVDDSTAIASVLGQPRSDVSRHWFVGGNFFILRMLNRYRDELGVAALPNELDAAVRRTEAFLRTETARVVVERAEVADGELEAVVAVENLTGHKLPTAYPSRRAWLHVAVHDHRGVVVFESGTLRADGSIVGNDNDADPSFYELHHDVIDSPEEVQVYETIMVGPDGAVTTGLTTGARHVKDNRILPAGFDRAAATEDISVKGRAAVDADFRGGTDRVRYRVSVAGAEGPFRVVAALRYQPISFRWAQNLRPYDAPETNRFVAYFDSMAEYSAIVLAGGEAMAR